MLCQGTRIPLVAIQVTIGIPGDTIIAYFHNQQLLSQANELPQFPLTYRIHLWRRLRFNYGARDCVALAGLLRG